jgi:hypothetical protein
MKFLDSHSDLDHPAFPASRRFLDPSVVNDHGDSMKCDDSDDEDSLKWFFRSFNVEKEVSKSIKSFDWIAQKDERAANHFRTIIVPLKSILYPAKRASTSNQSNSIKHSQ